MVRPVAVRCRGGANSCRARVSLAGGASNKRVAIELSDTDLRLVSVRPNRGSLRGAYGLSATVCARGVGVRVQAQRRAVDPARLGSAPCVPGRRRLRQGRGGPAEHDDPRAGLGNGRTPPRRGWRAGMRLLILGGTLFLGRHLAEEALGRGHALTLFNRGRAARSCFRRRSSCAAIVTATSTPCAGASGTR